MRIFFLGFLIFVILMGISCSPSPTIPVSEQLARGQVIYEEGCDIEACHGKDGAGIPSETGFRVWPLVGEDFQRRNPTAQVIFDVVRSGGEPSLRALTDQDVYDSIAYELSLNGVQLTEPLGSQNAPVTISGTAAKAPEPGGLFPPPGNAELISPWPEAPPALPLFTENSDLRLRLTQIALTASIGGREPLSGGSYVLMVLTFEDLADSPLEVGPEQLKLVTADGHTLAPQEFGLAYPVARFYHQTIQPEHGTTALVIFALPKATDMDHLLYTLDDGEQLVLPLMQ